MLVKLIRDGKKNAFQPYVERTASDLDLTEKDLENWMAGNPELLFGVERVLVISQSVSGQSMADILALDADGCLIIVEIKRDWSNRATVGQLLEYAAEMTGKNYEDLEKLNRHYWPRRNGERSYLSLLERFRALTDDPKADQKVIAKRQKGHRIYIVAPGSDKGLLRIVEWLKEYGVPISFVPFTLHAGEAGTDDADILLEIEPLSKVPLAVENIVAEWQGDWFFNTNETNAPDAYRKMFKQGVIAICAYETGAAKLTGSAKGQRVFAYVNKKGILAVGSIVDGQAVSGNTVFNKDHEFHVKVEWEAIVADDKGITNEEVLQNSADRLYRLPVRNVFCGMSRHDIADWIAGELQRRADQH